MYYSDSSPHVVQISCATPGAAIWYSVDDSTGADPGPSNPCSRQYDPMGYVILPSYGHPLKAKADPSDGMLCSAANWPDYVYQMPGSSGNPPGNPPDSTGDADCPYSFSQFPPDAPGIGLAVTGIYQTATGPDIHLQWTNPNLPNPNTTMYDVFTVKRQAASDNIPWTSSDTGSLVTLCGSTQNLYFDDTTFTPGASYKYAVQGSAISDRAVSEPYLDSCAVYNWGPGNWNEIHVTPVQQTASMNQSVDSRLDTRYIQNQLDEFPVRQRNLYGRPVRGLRTNSGQLGGWRKLP